MTFILLLIFIPLSYFFGRSFSNRKLKKENENLNEYLQYESKTNINAQARWKLLFDDYNKAINSQENWEQKVANYEEKIGSLASDNYILSEENRKLKSKI